MTLTPTTCFVLTPAGAALARELLRQGQPAPAAPGLAPHNGDNPAAVPTWNRDRRELSLHGVLIKQYKLPAPNQESVLAAFEEEHWPARIDDPLPGNPGVDPKRRLHETIASLNRNQKQRLLQFMGDGSGQGVRWECLGNGHHGDGA
jgi:hypothetical protein